MLQNVRNIDAPSTRAASISSYGRADSRYWVIQNTPNAVTRPGTMTAWSWPIHPSCFMTRNSGTTPSWVGTAVVAMTNTRSGPRPLKRSFANEKPASVENRTTESDVMTAMITELVTAFQKPMSDWRTRWTFSMKWLPGI